MGVTKELWNLIKGVLCVPHFSNTKRLDLIHEPNIPVIFSDDFLIPVINVENTIFRRVAPSESHRMFYNMCSGCCEYSLRYDPHQDFLKCEFCGKEELYDPPVQFTRNSRRTIMPRRFSGDFYKRLVHFKFWLKRIQGKEKNQVTSTIVEHVRNLLHKDNCRLVHYWVIRNALKRLGYQNYYDNAVYIMSKIRGTPLVNMNKSQEECLMQMFLELKDDFTILSRRRVNMLSYPYLIKKFCEIRGWKNMAKIIPTLKSNSRIAMQDDLWKTICRVRNWPFIPTVQWTSLETRSPNGRQR